MTKNGEGEQHHPGRINSPIKQALVTKLNKTHSRWRPRQRWLDRVKTNLSQVEQTASMQDADNPDNRDRWKNLVEATKDLNGLVKALKKNFVSVINTLK
ncbi:hypothetical protein ACI65C_004623 [Semiaphis heraclei]